MPIEIIVLLVVVVVLLALSILKAEKVIKLTLGSYLLLPFSMGLGEAISQLIFYLESYGEGTLLGLSYTKLAILFTNAQPTIVFLFFILLLLFIVKNSYFKIAIAQEPFQKHLQTLIWSVLALFSFMSYLYFSLSYLKGEMFEYFFSKTAFNSYIVWFPLFGVITALGVIIASSHIQIKFGKKSTPIAE